MSIPATWKRVPWGGFVDQFGVPHAPTDLTPYTARCLERCSRCKDKPCSKSNGHEYGCNCHYSSCAPQHHKNGSVTYGRAKVAT